MKTAFKSIVAISIFMISFVGFGQELEEAVIYQINNPSIKQLQLPAAQTENSSIFIVQVGTDNLIETSANSPNVELALNQNGSNNVIRMIDSADKINVSVIQNGNQNTLTKYNFFSNTLVNSTFIQNGNNQDINVFGENSISETMKITMTGDGQSLIVRNFN
ncbi:MULTISPECIES: hypothetical protein [unclassified Leeuwenhoekiella]|mgnify:CR=1 FL=1|uniref:hypothetical protein n=1 Tax=unclassified Leeuwenhoekiella TaxID=2615029 RepID=UPI000C3EE5A1|nr:MULTISPECIES: hypothetical protein [unclassified Leeuwenhoekiella]MAW93659.1 hypothetical protein [Leeuwenhoekiella sp.]MBA80402.1 hypothetical protein [Leeuwenhoekiella sp.]|tara:strand:+ start:16542 stop:17027 length:486 start_codon:yes stop_codon:yes gene_type:complete